jgi:hypothetical protein
MSSTRSADRKRLGASMWSVAGRCKRPDIALSAGPNSVSAKTAARPPRFG